MSDSSSPLLTSEPIFSVTDLHAWYSESHTLQGMTFSVVEGEVVTLLGRNGAGKTTTLKATMGIIEHRAGSVIYNGQELIGMASNRIARLGIAYCPQDRGIFSTLSLQENLMLPPEVQPGGMTVQEIYQIFPNLLQRRGTQGSKLSGGEQQMLAIGRILRTGAKLLLLDEPTEGLAPIIIQEIGTAIQKLKRRGFTILLVEQNLRFAATVADRNYVVEHGRVIDFIEKDKMTGNLDKLHKYLGI